jgi:predicted enzyme related to lactoylglutathione lyase
VKFYGSVFGWQFIGPGEMPGEPSGSYLVARMRGCDVAGVGSMPASASAGPPAWVTHVRVESADAAVQRALDAGGRVIAEPFDAHPAGRMAVLSDPAGAVFCVWEPMAREGAQRVNEPGAWSMSILNTPDPEGASRFYGAVFGWETESFGAGNGGVTLWRLPGYVGGEPGQPVPRDVVGVMAAQSSRGSSEPRWSVDFWVADLDAAADASRVCGGSVLAAPRDVPGFRQAVIADPQGAVFSASQLLMAS